MLRLTQIKASFNTGLKISTHTETLIYINYKKEKPLSEYAPKSE